MTDEVELHPDRVRLNALVAFCAKRSQRAAARLAVVHTECAEAAAALDVARDRLAAWIEANPDPQMELI